MHRRLYAQLAALSLLPALAGGCTQMTRHSNMIIFGTNTVVGVRVGTSATQVPSVDVGFSRQELVLMPVVANSGLDDKGRMEPCDMTANGGGGGAGGGGGGGGGAGAGGATDPAVNPCLLLGVRKSARDSYSVLASFGGHFDGSASAGNGARAQGGVSQYFATGMAAQLLALNGGAAVVSSGPAAEKAAETPPMTLEGLSPGAGEAKTAVTYVATLRTGRAALADKVANTAQADLAAQFTAFQGAIGGAKKDIMASGMCTDPASCSAAIEAGYYNTNFAADPAAFSKAIDAWK